MVTDFAVQQIDNILSPSCPMMGAACYTGRNEESTNIQAKTFYQGVRKK